MVVLKLPPQKSGRLRKISFSPAEKLPATGRRAGGQAIILDSDWEGSASWMSSVQCYSKDRQQLCHHTCSRYLTICDWNNDNAMLHFNLTHSRYLVHVISWHTFLTCEISPDVEMWSYRRPLCTYTDVQITVALSGVGPKHGWYMFSPGCMIMIWLPGNHWFRFPRPDQQHCPSFQLMNLIINSPNHEIPICLHCSVHPVLLANVTPPHPIPHIYPHTHISSTHTHKHPLPL